MTPPPAAAYAQVLQNGGDVVGEHYDEVAVLQQRESAVHGLELIGHDLDFVIGQTTGDEAVANESCDLARLATSEIGVLLDDHVIQPGREPAELADILVTAIARRGDHADASPGIDAYHELHEATRPPRYAHSPRYRPRPTHEVETSGVSAGEGKRIKAARISS